MRVGQGLIEIIVAIAILVTALTAVMALAVSNVALGRESELRLIGANLAREGVEVVRNTRDTNRLKAGAGLLGSDAVLDADLESATDYTVIAVFNPAASPPSWTLDFSPNDFNGEGTRVYRVGGFYLQAPTPPLGSSLTPFLRLLTLNEICKDGTIRVSGFACGLSGATDEKVGIQILSEVRWQVRGRTSKTIVEDRIYKW